MKSLFLNRKFLISILFAVSFGQRVYSADCQVGDVISPGESCAYPGTNVGFTVNNDGKAQFNNLPQGLPWLLRLLFGGKFEDSVNVNADFNGVAYKFEAIQRADGSWEIRVVGENAAKPPPPPVQKPDLVVPSARVNDATLEPGQRFTLSATVRNSGNGGSAATTLRYYRSGDKEISTRDTQVGTDRIGALAANRTSRQNISLTAPTTPGTYFYGACVDNTQNESDINNNCSTSVSVSVTTVGVDPKGPQIYWTGHGKIQRANLDGANIENLVTQGLNPLTGITLDLSGGKMYWADWQGGKIQRANLDGSNIEDLVTRGLKSPRGITLDISGSKMYWPDAGTGKIQRANLDGSNIEDLVTKLGEPTDIALDVSGDKMYWADWGTRKIQRANLDGSNIEDLILITNSRPHNIALDVSGDKMYWTNTGTAKIQRANLDGSNIEDLVTQGLRNPLGIALDVAAGKMYWADEGANKIQRANLDGSNIEDLVTQGLNWPRGIVLAIPSQTVPSTSDLVVQAVRAQPTTVAPGEKFWLHALLKNIGTEESAATTVRYYQSTDAVISTADTQSGKTRSTSIPVNGTNRRSIRVTAPTTPGTYYYGACVDSVPNESDTANNCSPSVSVSVTDPLGASEDVNGDGIVDVEDLVSVARQFGKTGPNAADVNGDGVVNVDDLILVAAVLDAGAAAAPALYSDALEGLAVADVQLWLSQAKMRDVTDPSVQRGILFLEQLLTALIPKETALLPNYPNPFNPETWIPYQLSKSAAVTLTIYDIQGRVVRALDLAHRRAGMYQTRSRAAYWDGKNDFGEQVASGVYFYTLSAGEFSASRKMLIRK